MGRSNGRGNSEKKHTLLKRRCSVDRCRKKAMDLIDGNYLCRIHSPVRKGYVGGEK